MLATEINNGEINQVKAHVCVCKKYNFFFNWWHCSSLVVHPNFCQTSEQFFIMTIKALSSRSAAIYLH